MSHSHSHTHSHSNTGDIRLAFFLNLGFTLFEIAGGVAINSVAILSDALHDLGDSFSLGLGWYLEGYSEKASDQKYSYGYRRFSLLGAFMNALILVGGSLLILSQTIPRLADPEPFSAPGMIVFALIGVAVNGFAALRLRGSASANAQMIGWHLLEDVLGWAAVLVVGIVSLFVNLPILDPILSVLITLYVLFNVLRNLKNAAELFLQAVPSDINADAVMSRLLAIEGVKSAHHLHIWSLDGEHNVFTTHLVIDENASKEDMIRIKAAGRDAVRDMDVEHITIEVEYENEDCTMKEDQHI